MTDNPALAVAFTGHRHLPPERQNAIIVSVDRLLASLYAEGCRRFITGGAIGFDTLAACRVVIFKREHPDVTLTLALPCRDQTERWTNEQDLRLYQYLLGAADETVYMQTFYTSGCMMDRNRWMVDHADTLIACLMHPAGGTASTVRYAREKHRRIFNVAK